MHAHLALGPSGGEVGVVAALDGVRAAAGALHRGERPRARVVDLLPHRDRLHHGRGRVARLGRRDRAVPGHLDMEVDRFRQCKMAHGLGYDWNTWCNCPRWRGPGRLRPSGMSASVSAPTPPRLSRSPIEDKVMKLENLQSDFNPLHQSKMNFEWLYYVTIIFSHAK